MPPKPASKLDFKKALSVPVKGNPVPPSLVGLGSAPKAPPPSYGAAPAAVPFTTAGLQAQHSVTTTPPSSTAPPTKKATSPSEVARVPSSGAALGAPAALSGPWSTSVGVAPVPSPSTGAAPAAKRAPAPIQPKVPVVVSDSNPIDVAKNQIREAMAAKTEVVERALALANTGAASPYHQDVAAPAEATQPLIGMGMLQLSGDFNDSDICVSERFITPLEMLIDERMTYFCGAKFEGFFEYLYKVQQGVEFKATQLRHLLDALNTYNNQPTMANIRSVYDVILRNICRFYNYGTTSTGIGGYLSSLSWGIDSYLYGMLWIAPERFLNAASHTDTPSPRRDHPESKPLLELIGSLPETHQADFIVANYRPAIYQLIRSMSLPNTFSYKTCGYIVDSIPDAFKGMYKQALHRWKRTNKEYLLRKELIHTARKIYTPLMVEGGELAQNKIFEFLNGPKQVCVLFGDTGMGKTRLLESVIDSIYERGSLQLPYIPIYVPFEIGRENIKQFIEETIRATLGDSLQKQPPTIFVLDGFDELNNKQKIKDFLFDLIIEWPGSKFIISSRKTEMHQSLFGQYSNTINLTAQSFNHEEFFNAALRDPEIINRYSIDPEKFLKFYGANKSILDVLSKTPFFAVSMIEIIPIFLGNNTQTVSQESFLQELTTCCFRRELKKFSGHGVGNEHAFIKACIQAAKKTAASMQNGKISIREFDNLGISEFVRHALPLTSNGEYYSFVREEMFDYFSALGRDETLVDMPHFNFSELLPTEIRAILDVSRDVVEEHYTVAKSVIDRGLKKAVASKVAQGIQDLIRQLE